MDRRSFIKLTAITGTSATLASCGNPENELIRFIPDESIVPGVAVWKPGEVSFMRMAAVAASHFRYSSISEVAMGSMPGEMA